MLSRQHRIRARKEGRLPVADAEQPPQPEMPEPPPSPKQCRRPPLRGVASVRQREAARQAEAARERRRLWMESTARAQGEVEPPRKAVPSSEVRSVLAGMEPGELEALATTAQKLAEATLQRSSSVAKLADPPPMRRRQSVRRLSVAFAAPADPEEPDSGGKSRRSSRGWDTVRRFTKRMSDSMDPLSDRYANQLRSHLTSVIPARARIAEDEEEERLAQQIKQFLGRKSRGN
eukprot:TRINITY_DN26625_c0_g1_i1.p2 TRINITY_DN26625_c0_g1~~TRINITY_DN26625_c0_g1_i1.p2  ORF type:complete len:233 (+),score=36.15 TRINITY_DN26625_c0_g1_i1:515-1213(+)